MMATLLNNVQAMQPFDPSEMKNISACWDRRISAFKLYADGKGVTGVAQKGPVAPYSWNEYSRHIFHP